MNDFLWTIPLVTSALVFCAVWSGTLALLPFWDFAAEKQMNSQTTRFVQLGLEEDQLRFYLRCWGISVVFTFCFFWFALRMPPVAIACTLLAYVAPRHILGYLIRCRIKKLRNQLVAASVGLANAVKAGLSIAQGLETVCTETPKPLRNELARIVFEFERGRPLREAIESVRQRLNLESFTVFSLAIETSLERGGRINESLERISTSLQEHQRLERKLEADTAAGRQVILLLSLFPIGFLCMFYLLSPDSTSLLFTTFVGHIVLVAAIAFVYGGCIWAARMLRIEL